MAWLVGLEHGLGALNMGDFADVKACYVRLLGFSGRILLRCGPRGVEFRGAGLRASGLARGPAPKLKRS